MDTVETGVGEPALVYWRPKPTPFLYPHGIMVSPPPGPIAHSINPAYPITHSQTQNQNSQLITDSFIQDEVIRAAKMLFSKRNRTLMHWLNPEISKNQLRIDVNAAWDSLPSPEKFFYISQVLGKFVPHMSSMMIKPHLAEAKHTSRTYVKKGKNVNLKTVNKEQNDTENHINNKKQNNYCNKLNQEHSDSNDSINVKEENNDDKIQTVISDRSGCVQQLIETTLTEPKQNKQKKRQQKRQLEYDGEDEASRDSALVIDVKTADTPKVKRKYTKRKVKNPVGESTTNDVKGEITYCPMPVDVKDVKVDPTTDPVVPRVKRKYVKHKLFRKKYKKREQKHKPTENTKIESNVICEQSVQKSDEQELPYEDMDLWIELSDDLVPGSFGLLDDEVDSIWETIGDPSSFFKDLHI